MSTLSQYIGDPDIIAHFRVRQLRVAVLVVFPMLCAIPRWIIVNLTVTVYAILWYLLFISLLYVFCFPLNSFFSTKSRWIKMIKGVSFVLRPRAPHAFQPKSWLSWQLIAAAKDIDRLRPTDPFRVLIITILPVLIIVAIIITPARR